MIIPKNLMKRIEQCEQILAEEAIKHDSQFNQDIK
jgi:hypothetical protein